MPAQAGGAKFDWRVLLSGLASAGANYSRNRQQDRQQEELAAGQDAARAKQLEADKKIGDEVASLSTSGPGAIQERSLADYSRAINANRSTPPASVAPGLGGERFKADTKSADLSTQQRGGRGAQQLAAIDAPQQQRIDERAGFARASDDAANLGREGNTEQFLAQLAARRHRPNPWVELLAQLGTQIGSHYEPTGVRPPSGEIVPGKVGPYRAPPRRNIWDVQPGLAPGAGVRK